MFEYFGLGGVVIVLGALSAFCIALDAASPRGVLHNVHRRAFHDLRALQGRIKREWDQIKLTTEQDSPEQKRAVAELIARFGKKSDEIAEAIAAAEASLGVSAKSEKSLE